MENIRNTENNKLIAEFMDMPINFNIQYDTDWNWLMEVTDKIESLGYWINIKSGAGKMVQIGKLNQSESLFYVTGEITISVVYDAVLEFIRRYNFNNPTI